MGLMSYGTHFESISFVIKKKPRKSLVVLYAHARGTVLELRLAADSPGLQGFRWNI